MPDGFCDGCQDNQGIHGKDVLCSSQRHARFMDTYGSKRWQRLVQKTGVMPIKYTGAGGTQIPCPDYTLRGGKQ